MYISFIKQTLDELYPNPPIPLNHTDAFSNNNQWGKDKVQMHLDISDFRWNETRVYIKNRKGEVVFARRRAPTMEAFEVFISCCFGIEVSRKDLKSMRGVK